ncbi:MAG: acyl-CoA desaturase [Anditalea sp.]
MGSSIKFIDSANSLFFATVKKRIEGYFKRNNISKRANQEMVVKTMVYLFLFIGFYAVILLNVLPLYLTLLMAIGLGIIMALIGFNICHDALHGSYSNKKWVNSSLGFIFNLIGANVYIWKISHNKVHHTYTNIVGHDGDLEVAPGLIRISPVEKKKAIHRYQHLYAFPLYSLAAVSWFFRKDYVKFFQKNIGAHVNKHPKIEYFNLFFYKMVYYALFIIIPFMIMDITWWQFLIGFLAMNFAEGLVMALVFQLAHLVEETDMPHLQGNENVEEAWAEHQMRTTANFSRNSKTAVFLFGGLNYQIEHHLFPKICHIHYPAISEIIKQTAHEFNLPYHENRSFYSALKSHYLFLKKLGRQPEVYPPLSAKPDYSNQIKL